MKLDSSKGKFREVGWETNTVQICLFMFMHVYESFCLCLPVHVHKIDFGGEIYANYDWAH